MKSCDYCGKENEDSLTHCAECGTELTPQELVQQPVANAPRVLDAKTATIILFLTIFAQAVAAIITGFVAEMFQPGGFGYSPGDPTRELEAIMPACVLVAMIAGAAAMWITTYKFKIPVRDTSLTGSAWVVGPQDAIVKGIGIGMLIAFASHIILHFFGSHWEADDLTRMVFIPGVPRMVYVIAGVFLAPPLEEMLFRGVLFGGFCRSVGFDRAAVGVTAIFVLLHAFQLLAQPLATVGITAMAIAALWMRVRHQTIGAAVAVHFGFNFLATLSNLL